MIFDTDILIWIESGNIKAAQLVEKEQERHISIQTYMELLQCAQNKYQQDHVRGFLKEYVFLILPLTENIGHRAAIYIEEYSLAYGIRAGDAIIAATASEHNLMLCSSNVKHFQPIRDIKLRAFRP